uniref:NADH dehydrogenase subunit 4L n=1 Tax=Gefionella okellyi TaxID=2853422 RepID=A0A0B5GWD2_9EUKA|nr:NADH dehydrogenase subunit 4L [Gefionella okellyi]
MTNNLQLFIFTSISLFCIGIWGIFLNRKNIIIIIMSIEIMLLGINLFFITTSILYNSIVGQIFTIFILTIAGAESAIGLALLIMLYKIRGSISIEYLNLMKG